MQSTTEPNIYEILPRFCEGNTTDEENLFVEGWVKASPENEAMFKQINTIHLAIDSIKIEKDTNLDKEFKKVTAVISNPKKINLWDWLQRVAAILFIPLFLMTINGVMSPVSGDVQMLEIKSNSGMTTTFTLPDGSVVHLNSNSVLKYPSSFKSEQSRVVELSGEGFFEVVKSSDRFIVNTAHQSKVEVLGTKFNLEAYEESPYVTTTVVEGSVAFDYKDKGHFQGVILRKGEQTVYNSEDHSCNLYQTTGESEIAWKDNKIILNNTTLEKTLRMLEKYYNVSFLIKNTKLKDNAFTGTFNNQRLERVLQFMYLTTDLNWREIEVDSKDQKRVIEIY